MNSRKVLTMYDKTYSQAGIDRLYLNWKEGGRGL